MATLNVAGLNVDGHSKAGFTICKCIILRRHPLPDHNFMRRWPCLGRGHPVPNSCLPCYGFVLGEDLRMMQQVLLQSLPSWTVIVVPETLSRLIS